MIDLFDELALVTKALRGHGIDYALVGGLAYCVWVESRNTEDIDLLIRPENWDRATEALTPLDYRRLAAPMDFGTIRIRRLTKFADRDVVVLAFLLADGTLAEGLGEGVPVEVNGSTFVVARPELIIRLKQGRMSDKDKSDIAGLQRIMREQ